jgi:hypothetical protein
MLKRKNLFRLFLFMLMILTVVLSNSGLSSAISRSDIESIIGGTPYYDAGCTVSSNVSASADLVWPFATKSDSQYNRVDQGWDIQDKAGAEVYAIAAGTIHVFNPDNGGFGNDYPTEKLDVSIGGPSDWIYYGHVHVLPSVINKHVSSGQQIAVANKTDVENGSDAYPGWLEIGFARPGTDAPVASGGGYEVATPEGQKMKDILIKAKPVSGSTAEQPAATCVCGVSSDATLIGRDPIEKAYNFFIQKGLTAEQSAGIVGNFIWESSVDPTKAGGDGDTNTPTDTWGIAQWTRASGRLPKLESYAKAHSLDITKLATQLNFSWFEFSTPQGGHTADLAHLKQTSNPDAAALVIFNEYEGAGDSTGPDRQEKARFVFAKYGDSGGVIGVPVGSSGACASTGPGQDTKYIDGFTVYSQCDPDWKDKRYGFGGTSSGCAGPNTIGTDGCGPTAMAMVITNLIGNGVTPDATAKYADSQNQYAAGQGSKWSIAPVLAKHWGLSATPIGNSIAKINATLQAGGLVIASGQGPLPFTSGGHYIVIRGLTADGKWKIGDSAHSNTSDKEWSPQQLLVSMNDGSVYAITQ